MEMYVMIHDYDNEDEDDVCLWVFTDSVEKTQSGMLPGLGCWPGQRGDDSIALQFWGRKSTYER